MIGQYNYFFFTNLTCWHIKHLTKNTVNIILIDFTSLQVRRNFENRLFINVLSKSLLNNPQTLLKLNKVNSLLCSISIEPASSHKPAKDHCMK